MLRTKISLILAPFLLIIGCSRTAVDYVQRGNRAFEEKRYDEALLEYRNAIKQDSAFGEAHYRLALVKLQKQEALDSYADLRRAVELLPQRDDIRVKLGDVALNLYLESGLKTAALQADIRQIADHLLNNDSNSFDGLRFLGYLALTDKDAIKAIHLFEQASKVKPDSPEVLIAQTQAHFLNHQFKEGEAVALECIRIRPTYLPAYGFLYDYYQSSKRTSDAGRIVTLQVRNNPKDLSSRLKEARHYAGANNISEMERVIAGILQNASDFPDARLAIGDLCRRIGRPEEALLHYRTGRQMATQRPSLSVYLKRIGETNFVLGKFDESLKDAQEAVANDSGDLDAALLQTRIMIATGKSELVESAVSLLRSKSKSNPENAEVRFQLGSAYFKREQWSEARAELIEAVRLNPIDRAQLLALSTVSQKLGAHGDVVKYASAVLRFQPDEESARLLLASGLVGTGRGNEARQELNQLLRRKPDYGAALLQLALLNISEKRYREADQMIDRLYAPGKSDSQVVRALVQSRVNQKQFDRARQVLEREIETSKQPSELRSMLAAVDATTGRTEMAINGLKTAISEKPDLPAFHIQLASVYRQQKNLDAASQTLDAAVQRFPGQKQVIWEAVALNELRGERAKAIERYRMLQKLEPNNANVMNNIAFSLAESGGDLNEALRLAEGAVRQDPQSPVFADTLAWVQLKKGNADSAVNMLQNLVRRYPDDAGYRGHLKAALEAPRR